MDSEARQKKVHLISDGEHQVVLPKASYSAISNAPELVTHDAFGQHSVGVPSSLSSINMIDKPIRPVTLQNDKGFPFNLQGIVHLDGDMTHFVAENLEYKIKCSSPLNKRDLNYESSSSHNSTPSATRFMQPKYLGSNDLHTDCNVLFDIEIEAQYLAASVDNLSENLCSLVHSISAITADNVEIHRNAVHKLTDNMDANIKSMYTIMAKTEEISKAMQTTEQLSARIREIRRLVELLEHNL